MTGKQSAKATAACAAEPSSDCPLCPRLADFRHMLRKREPSWFNAPVPSWGSRDAQLLVVGLAPGMHGANRTGRPFTGDYAGDLLYATLKEYGFAEGEYEERPDDTLTLIDARISNAVRCLPPENKPLPEEINTCRTFLQATLAEMPKLKAVIALGHIAHNAMVRTLGAKLSAAKFGHGAVHDFGNMKLFDSYHCSRYNTNTGVLTPEMFRAVFKSVRGYLSA